MKGQIFTVATFMMMLALTAFALAFANSSLSSMGDVSLLSSADKVDFLFESLKSGAHQATGVTIQTSDTNITINDTIPRSVSFRTHLQKYNNFTEDEFENQAVNITFLNQDGSAVNWNSVENLTIKPMNISYRYPLSGDEIIEVRSQSIAGLGQLDRMDINLTSDTTMVAGTWSESLCSPPGSPPECLPIRIIVADPAGTWNSGEKNFNMSSESSITHTIGLGFITIKVGKSLLNDDRIVRIDTDGIVMNSSVRMSFDTTDISYSMGPKLKISDVLVSREADI